MLLNVSKCVALKNGPMQISLSPFFPKTVTNDITGGFDATYWSDKITLQVIAENVYNFHLPTPHQLDVTGNSGTLSTQTHPTKKAESHGPLAPVGKQSPSRKASKVWFSWPNLMTKKL